MDPRSAAMLDLCEPIWFTHIHRSIVQMSRNCRQCTERGENLGPFLGKIHSLQIESTVEPNEEVQLDFAGLLPNELNREAYILVAIDYWSNFRQLKWYLTPEQPQDLCKDINQSMASRKIQMQSESKVLFFFVDQATSNNYLHLQTITT